MALFDGFKRKSMTTHGKSEWTWLRKKEKESTEPHQCGARPKQRLCFYARALRKKRKNQIIYCFRVRPRMWNGKRNTDDETILNANGFGLPSKIMIYFHHLISVAFTT